MSKRINDVTLFSNGIGHFRRLFVIAAGKEEKISIPFKSDFIGDVAASLQVFGKVRLNTPPSFTPANSNATALSIDSNDAYKSLLRQLSGSAVKISVRDQADGKYTLLGLDSEQAQEQNRVVHTTYVVVGGNGQVRRFRLQDVTNIDFEDEGVRTEIEKALKANFQQIKPDSTLLDLSMAAIEGAGDVEAIVQYTIPVAAWKMRYAIREDKGKFMLEGAAIIDNNTDEDWHDFKVSVVTGNPISFNTDIANVVVPKRKMIHLVDGLSISNVDVEQGYEYTGGGVVAACAGNSPNRRTRNLLGAKMSATNYAQFGLESTMDGEEQLESMQEIAEAPGVDAKDVGDFCVFTSKEPITILARKSAVVPMFSKALDHAGVVLLYKESNNARRPYRSVKFKNETEYTLGRGKTVIYNEGIFSGECVLETSKPGENRMLPHCLENGVKIVKEVKAQEQRRSSIKITEGVIVTEEVQTAKIQYIIENKKDEPFKVALEHSNTLYGNAMTAFDGIDIKEKERLVDSNGWRIYFELKPKETRTLTVSETQVDQASFVINGNFQWAWSHYIDPIAPLSSNKQLQVCLKIQKDIDAVAEEINDALRRVQELNEQVNRVRSNLVSAKDVTTSKTVDGWVTDLDLSENEIRTINKERVPTLRKRQRELTAKLSDELKNVTVSWKDK